ncbi:MAG: hypothetical protein IJB84_00695 [Lachnospiraceae bacterium]|nr:hypothetical protein [Lachnospiraceae bacterium]
MKKETGVAGEFPVVCLCLLALTVLLFSYLGSVKLIQQKETLGQIARKYILIMETFGYLGQQDRQNLMVELEEMGLEQISLAGTSTSQRNYGDEVALIIRGVLEDGTRVVEERYSTAKN